MNLKTQLRKRFALSKVTLYVIIAVAALMFAVFMLVPVLGFALLRVENERENLLGTWLTSSAYGDYEIMFSHGGVGWVTGTRHWIENYQEEPAAAFFSWSQRGNVLVIEYRDRIRQTVRRRYIFFEVVGDALHFGGLAEFAYHRYDLRRISVRRGGIVAGLQGNAPSGYDFHLQNDAADVEPAAFLLTIHDLLGRGAVLVPAGTWERQAPLP